MSNSSSFINVWEWPEFQAFAKRLGISTDKPSSYLRITLPFNTAVEIEHQYYGQDTLLDPKANLDLPRN